MDGGFVPKQKAKAKRISKYKNPSRMNEAFKREGFPLVCIYYVE